MSQQKKLSEVVLATQQTETQFEKDGPYLLEQLATPDPWRDDTAIAKIYAHTVAGVGRLCDEIIESRSQESSES